MVSQNRKRVLLQDTISFTPGVPGQLMIGAPGLSPDDHPTKLNLDFPYTRL